MNADKNAKKEKQKMISVYLRKSAAEVLFFC